MTPGMLKPPWHFPIRRGGPPESSGALSIFKKIEKKKLRLLAQDGDRSLERQQY